MSIDFIVTLLTGAICSGIIIILICEGGNDDDRNN